MLDEFVDDFCPISDNRSSTEELKRIKEFSDENLKIILNKINTDTKNDEDKRNILTNLIGALDYYIHEIIIWGLIQITLNKFPVGKNYHRLSISIKYLKNSIENDEIFDNIEFKKTIIDNIRLNSYQKWNKIKEGLEIILPQYILEKISNLTSGKNKTPLFQTIDLDKLAEKRHLIVHHFDREYNNNSLRNTIDIDCNEAYNLVSTIINSIHLIISEYDSSQPENI